MKKTLRFLCLGFAAMSFLTGTAQGENMSSKLKNADFEQGVKGWNIEGENFKKVIKSQEVNFGYHGMDNQALEIWESDTAIGLSDSRIMQTVTELPAGTYVFGAYLTASRQGTAWSNRDSIVGVTLFAGEASVNVATDDPEHYTDSTQWAHSAKFNVAVTLDQPGKMGLGLRVKGTNANFIALDNATLYYFNKKSKSEALDAMAKIDIASIVAAADTLSSHKMNTDKALSLTKAKQAAQKLAKAKELWRLSEELNWAIREARISIRDYENLRAYIDRAQSTVAGTWSDAVKKDLELLKNTITSAELGYKTATLDWENIAIINRKLEIESSLVRTDSLSTAISILRTFLDNASFGASVGQFPITLETSLESLLAEAQTALDEVETDSSKAITACQYIDIISQNIEALQNQVITVTQFPINLPANSSNMIEGTVMENNLRTYTSPLYTFADTLSVIRFTVPHNIKNESFFTLSSFEMFDSIGNEIPLTAEMFTSNADHNKLNPNSLDGQGIPGLVDDNPNTFFHSAWRNAPSAPHYLQVTLPNGKYNAFSFKMVARATNQNHQFPGAMLISSVTELGDNLQILLNEAQAIPTDIGTTIGFYGVEHTAKINALKEAITVAENCINVGSNEAEKKEAIDELNAAIAAVKSVSIILPDRDKKYRIISAYPAFFEKQGVEKALTVHATDSTTNLWWENLHIDSLQQEFVFEPLVDTVGHRHLYALKNAKHDSYVQDFAYNRTYIDAALDTIELVPLGHGQFNIKDMRGNTFHTGDHNSGTLGAAGAPYGGTWGLGSCIVSWAGGLDGASAWYITEIQSMPLTITTNSGKFQSDFYHLPEGANTFSFSADKLCSFDSLALCDLFGNVIETRISAIATMASVTTTTPITAFSFRFNNTEGVKKIFVVGGTSSVNNLRNAYESAQALAPEKGNAIMQYLNLDEYDAALEHASSIINSSNPSEKEINAAIAQLDSAVAHLKPNLPEQDKRYYIYNAYEPFEENHNVRMMLWGDTANLKWGYENTEATNHIWTFEAASDSTDDYYIRNFATGLYIGITNVESEAIKMVAHKDSTEAYTITALQGAISAIAPTNNQRHRLHCQGHNSGAGSSGNICYWYSGLNTSSVWTIVSAEETFSLNQYIAHYMVDDKVIHADTLLHGDSLVAPIVADREGYSFSWKGLLATMPIKDIVVKGVYTPKNYTIIFKANNKVYAKQIIAFGDSITIPEIEGHTCEWKNVPATMPAKDLEITGKVTPNKYKVNYYIDGKFYISIPVEYNTALPPLDVPEKDGYIFTGWENIPERMPAHDIDIQGAYSVNSYVLTFMIDSIIVASDTLQYNDTIVAPEVPIREGYTFDGWKDLPETMPARHLTFNSLYSINSYMVTYTIDNVVIITDTIVYNDTIVAPEAPVREGYTFDGWSDIPTTMPAHNVNIEGSYSINSYMVTFMIDSVTIATDSLEYCATIVVPEAPVREGYTFDGWSEVPDSMPAHDLTFNSSYSINSYIVSFMIDGTVIACDTLVYGDTIVAPEAPELEGHTFNGWGEVAATVPASDVTYSGSYTANTYKVYYYVGETLVHTEEVTYGESIPEYTYEPTVEGDVFIGWIGDTYESMPAHDITYMANIANGISILLTTDSVDVYSLEGKKLFDGIRFDEAKRILTKGTYIINGHKVLIK